jgi:hypothetical protein
MKSGLWRSSISARPNDRGHVADPVTGSTWLKGAAFGFAAVPIMASWSAFTRLGVTTSLNACDIAALRCRQSSRGEVSPAIDWVGLD